MAINSREEYEKVVNVSWFSQEKSPEDLRNFLNQFYFFSDDHFQHSNIIDETLRKAHGNVRFPRSVQALYLKPLRREAHFGIPSCDLQLRSYSIRNLEFFCDFALRAAYYLDLPAFGPVPLPRITERWTVPRSSFIFKKSQENFERITLRRLIQIRDGNPESVQLWLAFLQKHAYYGIGMKANVWEFSPMGHAECTIHIALNCYINL
ncbi:37S ribosomal protein S10 like [Verticillium longisporum]|uniref:Small ribosomal subunit protein uS10m n=1 Tax=Verticillium longisporum TaxID=100787 RepID=A0A8I3AT27_VERLO|nr:37S ribosomal protein S10 like [Verticillium longisporum]